MQSVKLHAGEASPRNKGFEEKAGVSFLEGVRVGAMDKEIIVRGRRIGAAEVAFIRG